MIEDLPDIDSLVGGDTELLMMTAEFFGSREAPAHRALRVRKGLAVARNYAVFPVINGRTSTAEFLDQRVSAYGSLLDTPLEPEGELSGAFVMTGGGNYLHFLLYYFPALLFLRWAPGDTVTVLSVQGMPPSLSDLLDDLMPALAGGRRVMSLPLQYGTYAVNDCLFPLVKAKAFLPGLAGRRVILPYVLRKAGLDDPLRERGPLKLFIRREGSSTGRRLLNQDDIEAWFVARSYISVNPGDMSVDEQVILFARATHIAGVEGAAFANIIFAIHARVIVMLASPTTQGERFQACLVDDHEIVFTTIYGEVDPALPATRNSNFTVDIAKIRALEPQLTQA